MSEIQQLENYLQDTMNPADKLVMEARFIIDKGLKEKSFWQKQTYSLIAYYGRKQLKKEIESVHAKMFTEKRFESFRKKISNIFK